jgi:FkbM family methyltransferase
MAARIYWHFGTTSPRTVPQIEPGLVLHVDPTDFRARKKLIYESIRGRYPRNRTFWRSILPRFQPDTVLDIGLNYGECLFSLRYERDVRLFGFEANPGLLTCLQASRADHPNRNQMEILNQLVSAQDGQNVPFFIDRKWSGTSMAGLDVQNYDRSRYDVVQVRQSSIDSTLARRQCTPRKLFFKIDVEGYEANVFAGMASTLAEVREVIGFVEFDFHHLLQAGACLETYWAVLQKQFRVHAYARDGKLHDLTGKSLDALRQVCGKHLHTDLVLTQGISSSLMQTILETSGQAVRIAA